MYLVIAASGGGNSDSESSGSTTEDSRLYVTTDEYAVRLSLLVFVTAVPTLLLTGVPWLRNIVRHRSHRCVRCGYNLHGLTEPRYPECFTPFERSSESEAVSSTPESSQQDATP